MRIWIDIENPPQVQYLLPLGRAFERAGAEVIVTARDYGYTLELMRASGVPFDCVGEASGRSKWQKVRGTWGRSNALIAVQRERGLPDALLSPSRSAVIASWRLRVPSFVFADYEYSDMSVYRLAGSTVFFPDVIDSAALRRTGIKPKRLVPYAGLKEDVSFAEVDLEAVDPYDLPEAEDGVAKVLFRPPAEESHYFRDDSRLAALDVLRTLAERNDVLVVYSPRTAEQLAYLSSVPWKLPPVVIDRPVSFVPLLKAVDAVISAGGTMAREAAYLGVAAFSIFRGEMAAVDRYLESVGRLRIVDSAADFGRIPFNRGIRRPVLRSNPRLLDEVTAEILSRLALPASRGEEAARPRPLVRP